MEYIDKIFKDRKATHLLLNPDDISSVMVILKNSQRTINDVSPWNTEKGKIGTLQIIDWMYNLLETALLTIPEKDK